MLNKITDLFSGNTKGIGIEITPEKISLVQMSKKGQQYKLIKYCAEEVPEEIFEEGQIADAPRLAETIQEMLKQHKIKAKKIATAVPMRESIIRVIPIPAELDAQELDDMVLNHEAGLYLPYPTEEVDLDYQKLGSFVDEDGIEKVRVLLVATRKEVTDLYLETFAQAGLEIDVLEINSFALIRTLGEQLRQFTSTEAVVLVDIEFDSTEIAIIVEGVPQFSRTVPIGTYQLHSALAQAMNLPVSRNTEMLQEITVPTAPDGSSGSTTSTGQTWINPGMAALLRVLGDLVDELRRSINFYLNQSDGVEVAQVFIAGPGGGLGQLDEFFSKKLNLPAIQIDPITSLGVETKTEMATVQRVGLGTVIGLGMRMI
ncbi:MAG: type IV pilus assembly protein PilM [Gomphosphaeria aponina SAG 52.96 = DSM 107014]|uniref:Type IV pilus assembly protein PilM n=1 Tax=Gomphosphaeria aponina SAG 52.96 = DSM 107014 TaxID=1521640 RepID=A0A941GXM7_9CHRO|nr:type IV pilus assembly protein PilM [Gomphosphaeria aponina SAG 52.96 = DSM 107014]